MAVRDNQITTSNYAVSAREVDFASRFAKNIQALQDILGISRPIRKAPGTKLTSYMVTSEGGLQGGASVAEGEIIPLTELNVQEVEYGDIIVQKYARSVTIEAVSKYGADIAVQRVDDEFMNMIQGKVTSDFYGFLATGSGIHAATTWQMALAMAKGRALDKFASMDKTVTDVVGFANILDVYEWIGGANVTIQNEFGMNYVKNFMGYRTILLLPEKYIARGTVAATPVENLVIYYTDPSDSDYAKLGLTYRTDGDTNFIGVHVEGRYDRAAGDMTAIVGMKLWAEYLDGIIIELVDSSSTLGTLTVSSVAGTASGDTKITITETKGDGNSYVYKVGTAAEDVVYGQLLKTGWTAWDGASDITAATGKKITVAEVDGNKRAKAAGNATVTAKA